MIKADIFKDIHMSEIVKEEWKEKKKEIQSVPKALRQIIWGNPWKIFLFIVWIAMVVIIPFTEFDSDFIIAFVLIYQFFVFYALFNLIAGQIIGLVLTLGAVALSFFFFDISVEIFLWIGLGYLTLQELLTMENSSPIVRGLHVVLKKDRPLRHPGIILIVMNILFIIADFLYAGFICDNLEENIQTGIGFWELADTLCSITLVILMLLIGWRKDDFHQQLRSYIVWSYFILKIVTAKIAYSFYLAFSDLGGETQIFQFVNLGNMILLVLLAIWELATEIASHDFTPKKRRYFTLCLFLYGIGIYSPYMEMSGFDWSFDMYVIIFLWLGAILLVRKSAKDLAIKMGISNYKFLQKILDKPQLNASN